MNENLTFPKSCKSIKKFGFYIKKSFHNFNSKLSITRLILISIVRIELSIYKT